MISFKTVLQWASNFNIVLFPNKLCFQNEFSGTNSPLMFKMIFAMYIEKSASSGKNKSSLAYFVIPVICVCVLENFLNVFIGAAFQ